MTASIATDFRAEMKRILERYTGKPFDAISPISVASVHAIDARMNELEERAASCTCQRDERPFPINPRNKRIDYHWQMKRLHRMAAEDAAMQERGMS